MDKLKMKTIDIAQDNIERIGQLFPECITEIVDETGKTKKVVDFAVLNNIFNCSVTNYPNAGGGQRFKECYQFTWPDKSKARAIVNQPINATLRPCREESVNFDTTENLYIEGDNLDVLKLLRETYYGKVKMIYIDPPYNTGNDFVYDDDFSQDAETYKANSGQYDNQGNRLQKNSDTNGRFHTDWLNMMYPRLKVARDILSEDGALFISIDDNESENLKKICDEIMGETNFVGQMTLLSNPRGSQNSKNLSYVHEYIIVYAKNKDEIELGGIGKTEESLSEFSEEDEKGKYRLLGLRKRGGAWRKEDRPNMFFSVFVNPQNGKCALEKDDSYFIEVVPKRPSGELGRWTWGKDKFEKEKRTLIGKKVNKNSENEQWDIFRKDYKDNIDGTEKKTKLKTIWLEKETNYQNAKNEIKALFGNSEVFDYPKPTFIIKRLADILMTEEDCVLDFFSGSATTAHAVMQLNAEDGKKRKFIMVQLPEACDENSEAYKAGYKNICEIGKERIRRAGKKILEEQKNKEGDLFSQGNSDLDVGFRVLKLDSSNMEDVYYHPEDLSQEELAGLISNIKEGRTDEDLLFQVMLDLGVLLSSKIETEIIGGKKVFNLNKGYLIACFDENVDDDLITEVAKQKPTYFVMRDSSLADDSVSVNFDQIFEKYSHDTIRKVL